MSIDLNADIVPSSAGGSPCKLASCPFDMSHHSFLPSDIRRYSKFILYGPCPALESAISPRSRGSFSWRKVFRNQDLGAGCSLLLSCHSRLLTFLPPLFSRPLSLSPSAFFSSSLSFLSLLFFPPFLSSSLLLPADSPAPCTMPRGYYLLCQALPNT